MNLMSRDSSQTGFIHVLLLAGVLMASGLLASSLIQTTKVYSADNPSSVLGESENRAQVQNQVTVQQGQQQEVPPAAKIPETETKDSTRQETQTRTEDKGSSQSELEQHKVEVKQEIENKNNPEASLSGEAGNVENQAENKLEKEGIKIATEGGQPVIARNRVAARVNFPLSVDPLTNQLIVTTPAGQKAVTILPDQAVQNMLTKGILSKIDSSTLSGQLAGNLGSLNNVVDLEEKNNEMVYKLDGVKTSKLFGLIPVSLPTTAYVSAQTGNLVSQEQSVLANLIELLSR